MIWLSLVVFDKYMTNFFRIWGMPSINLEMMMANKKAILKVLVLAFLSYFIFYTSFTHTGLLSGILEILFLLYKGVVKK